jgi:REP-associated tyrosine transposase
MCNANTFGTTGTARHVVHRRNDGTACFFNDDDYLVYLDCLQDAAARHHCAIHCYVLMPDRAQLLVSPEAENRLPVMMRCVGGRYAEYMHYIYQHHGAFWEHGTKFSMVDGERGLLACHRTIESAPVQAGLAAGPAEYRWSSYHHHAHGGEDAVVRDHPSYLKLGATQGGRQNAYRELFRQSPSESQAGRDSLQGRFARLVGRDGSATLGAAALAPAAA